MNQLRLYLMFFYNWHCKPRVPKMNILIEHVFETCIKSRIYYVQLAAGKSNKNIFLYLPLTQWKQIKQNLNLKTWERHLIKSGLILQNRRH